MNILAVDCCLRLTGTALMIDGKIISSLQKDLGRRQSSELPLMVRDMLEKNNITWNEIDYVALTNGPGYFTGIRVGASYASGLAYACGTKIIPVSSLEMLSYSYNKGGKILVTVYAGHGYVYAWCGNFLEAGEYSHDEIYSWLNKNPDSIIISDDPERTGLKGNILSVRPSIELLCELANKKIDSAINPMELKISYYRAPQGVSNYK